MPAIQRAKGTIDEFNLTVSRMIEGKSDREIAILAGAYLEGLLFQLLSGVLVDSVLQKSKKLFEYPRPLSSFGNMISLAYAFGVISTVEFTGLQVVKSVRNFCAHSPDLCEQSSVSFDSEPVKKLLREFHPKEALSILPDADRKRITADFEAFLTCDPRMAFRFAFCHTGLALFARLQLTKPLESPDGIS